MPPKINGQTVPSPMSREMSERETTLTTSPKEPEDIFHLDRTLDRQPDSLREDAGDNDSLRSTTSRSTRGFTVTPTSPATARLNHGNTESPVTDKYLLASDPRARFPKTIIDSCVDDAVNSLPKTFTYDEKGKIKNLILSDISDSNFIPLEIEDRKQLTSFIKGKFVNPIIEKKAFEQLREIEKQLDDLPSDEKFARIDIVSEEYRTLQETSTQVTQAIRNKIGDKESAERTSLLADEANTRNVIDSGITANISSIHQLKNTGSKVIANTGNKILDNVIAKLVEEFNSRLSEPQSIIDFFKTHDFKFFGNLQANAYAAFLKGNNISKEDALNAAENKYGNNAQQIFAMRKAIEDAYK